MLLAPQECCNLCALASCDEPVESDIVVNIEAILVGFLIDLIKNSSYISAIVHTCILAIVY